jgi:hypothetical protein
MKNNNIINIVLVIVLMSSASFIANAQQKGVQQGIHEPGTGIESPELKEEMQGTGQGQSNSIAEPKMELRRSRVSSATQEMLGIANRNTGIGEQIRVIAQNQNRYQEEAEEALEVAKRRSGFTKFFIGSNYKQFKTVEDRLENHNQNIEELRVLRENLSLGDKSILDEQIIAVEEVFAELRDEAEEGQKGFSLFGWMNRLFRK